MMGLVGGRRKQSGSESCEEVGGTEVMVGFGKGKNRELSGGGDRYSRGMYYAGGISGAGGGLVAGKLTPALLMPEELTPGELTLGELTLGELTSGELIPGELTVEIVSPEIVTGTCRLGLR